MLDTEELLAPITVEIFIRVLGQNIVIGGSFTGQYSGDCVTYGQIKCYLENDFYSEVFSEKCFVFALKVNILDN